MCRRSWLGSWNHGVPCVCNKHITRPQSIDALSYTNSPRGTTQAEYVRKPHRHLAGLYYRCCCSLSSQIIIYFPLVFCITIWLLLSLEKKAARAYEVESMQNHHQNHEWIRQYTGEISGLGITTMLLPPPLLAAPTTLV